MTFSAISTVCYLHIEHLGNPVYGDAADALPAILWSSNWISSKDSGWSSSSWLHPSLQHSCPAEWGNVEHSPQWSPEVSQCSFQGDHTSPWATSATTMNSVIRLMPTGRNWLWAWHLPMHDAPFTYQTIQLYNCAGKHQVLLGCFVEGLQPQGSLEESQCSLQGNPISPLRQWTLSADQWSPEVSHCHLQGDHTSRWPHPRLQELYSLTCAIPESTTAGPAMVWLWGIPPSPKQNCCSISWWSLWNTHNELWKYPPQTLWNNADELFQVSSTNCSGLC